MTTDFNLSDKIVQEFRDVDGLENSYLYGNDIKEFIRRLKDMLRKDCGLNSAHYYRLASLIDELSGDKLK